MPIFETSDFSYEPSHHVPFRDKAALARARNIAYEDFLNYDHPNVTVKLMDDFGLTWNFITDIFFRIRDAMQAGRKLVMIIPQPWPMYEQVAQLINRCQIDCRNLYTFNMDEYADQDGNIAPESWPFGFTHALKKYFYTNIDPNLCPPEDQMVGLTNENYEDYGKMITDLGGADICYMGPGWTGHVAFVEPDAPEVPKDLEAFKQFGPAKVTLSPFTLAQNSLHGSFGASGDIAAVPPMAATIGPAQVLEAKERTAFYAIGLHGTATSWQRMIARLSLFGEVTPSVPDSIVQLAPSSAWVSHSIAQTIEVDWNKGY
jgi:6-phosphogluconolactonase/glucosamine-6-phosphate isomerase/deaminase